MTIGEYPAISLKDARATRESYRGMIVKGLDPRQVLKEQAQTERAKQDNTLEKVSAEWLQVRNGKIAPTTWKAIERRLQIHVFPTMGEMPITDITARDVLDLLRMIEKQSTDLSRKVKSNLSRIFSYAIQLGMTDRNPASDLVSRDVLKSHKTTHHRAMELEELPVFLKALDADTASVQVKSAIRLMVMLFMRKAELCNAEWSHIDLKAGLWTVPADNTKKRREQVYPLPRQAVAILTELQRYTGDCRYVFSTGARSKDAPVGTQTLNHVVIRTGFHRKTTVHGFRALATGWLDEQGYNRQAIERQLSHLERGQTNQAYHRADYMEERRQMLQAWADHIDSIREQHTGRQTSKAA